MERDPGLPADDFAELSRSVLLDLQQRVGMDTWLLSRRDGEDQVILSSIDEVFGLGAGSSRAWADSFCAQMVDGRMPMVVPDIEQEPAAVDARSRNGLPVGSCLSVPIVALDGEPLGTLCALDRQERPLLQDSQATVMVQARTLGALLDHALHSAHQARSLERSESDADVDQLTGVGNRRSWDAALRTEEARACRYAASVAVVVVNLGALREVNQEQGHQAGDELLIRAAAVLSQRLRAVDVLARVNGDEFGIILPGTSSEGAEAVVRDLRSLLTEAQIGAAVGTGQRRSSTGIAGAWQSADVAMHADKLEAAQRMVRHQQEERPAHAGGAVSTTAPGPLSSVDALLQLAKEQLGMDVAFLNTFEGTQRRFRNLVTSVELPIQAGFSGPRAGSYCQLIVDGVIDDVVPDVSADPMLRDLPATASLGIGSYIGIPVHRRNGSLYGTLCVFSKRADHTLRERDTGVLQAIAGVVMDLVEVEDRSDRHRHEILQRLDALYAGNGPHVVFQPIQTLSRLQTIGVEALSRFPEGSANPDRWFSSAAEAGVGETLELAALKNAIAVLPRLTGFLALNVSPMTLSSPGFARLMEGQPWHRIVLEITEHEAIDDYRRLLEVLRPLRAEGMRVAVDDAGAGFASMRHILALVPDFIKLDISLVRGIDTDAPRQALTAALAAFAFKTNALVIAEGIETVEELDCLRSLNIDCGQGYYLARPAPLAPMAERDLTQS